ncbi:LOW QUALITY PROTEIN: hypothetical protein OSB04_024577 [Centaurea solstitialis]|uniref:CCHC-type domain-containing protein n=1 Tax=Centaurea solstitialis TaxID=347529 RepID=A0AA38SYP6_9ASTR|nr:LOW QUALITY PROTEIN: hypothetical protein OSB04_024577 [Centaurea solstitialis]
MKKRNKEIDSSKGTHANHESVVGDNASGLGKRGCIYKTFSNTYLEKFSGSSGPLALMDWFNKIESYFEICKCAPEQKVRFVVTTFTFVALQWWNTEKVVRYIAEAAKMYWDSLKELMIEKYSSSISDTVQEYTDKFKEKARFVTHQVATEQSIVHRFVEGLRVEIKRYVEVIVPTNFLQAVVVAKIAEKSSDRSMRLEKMLIESGKTIVRDLRLLSLDLQQEPFGECNIGSTRCFKCGKLGLNQRECLESLQNAGTKCPKMQKDTAGSLRLVSGASESGNEKKEFPKAKGRAYVMTIDEEKETADVVSTKSRKELVFEIADGSQIEIEETVKVCTLSRFEIVPGIDWLSRNDAQLVCNKKTVKVQTPARKSEYARGDRKKRRDRNYLDAKGNKVRMDIQVDLRLRRRLGWKKNVKKERIVGQVKLLTVGPDAIWEPSSDFPIEVKLRAYVIHFRGSWDNHLSLDLLEALYDRKGRKPVCCTDVGKMQLARPDPTNLDKIVQIRERLKVAYDRQKSYAYKRSRPLEFIIGVKVMQRISPCKGIARFPKTGKLSPRYVGQFVVGTLHVSNLRRYLADESMIVELKDVSIDNRLSYKEEPVQILDRKMNYLCNKSVSLMLVQWKFHKDPEMTLEPEAEMKKK